MTRHRLLLGFLVAATACAPKDSAKTDTLQPVDTLRAATETLPDTATSTAQMKAGASTAAKGTTTSGAAATAKTKTDSIIGHDSVTPFDPKKPRLPTVKRP